MAETINTFQEGLLMDANPLSTPNNCLTNALNGTFITYNGNEFVLQNDMGNGRVETAYLPTGYIPVGVKEYGGIIYIASYNPIKNQSQIGCFPSPERIISSDEVEIPEQELDDATFGLDESENPNWETEGATSEYQKLEVFDPAQIFNPGDQFMIAIKQGNLSKDEGNQVLGEILSYYGVLKSYQDITIHLASLDEIGNITYIEKDLLKEKDTNYWMPYFDNSIVTEIQDPDQYRASIGNPDKYNIYKNKISGHLVLIVELEGMNNFDFTRKVDLLYRGTSEDISGDDDLSANYDTFTVTFNGLSDKYTEKDSADFNGYSFNYTLYEKNAAGEDVEVEKSQRWRIDGEDPNDTPNDHLPSQDSNNPNRIELSLNASLDSFSVSKANGFKRNNILKYEVIPFTDFLYLNRFRKTGIIDFSKINSGIHDLTEWRYYVDNNSISIAFGFDYNPLEGYRVDEVYFELYDICGGYSTYYPVIIRDEWSGNFTDVIEFKPIIGQLEDYLKDTTDQKDYVKQDIPERDVISLPISNKYTDVRELKKNNFYIVRICIRESYSENGSTKYKNTNFLRYLYTTNLFNQIYIENTEQDFQNLKPEVVARIIANISGENQYIESPVESGSFYKITEYDPTDPGILVSKLISEVKASAVLDLSSELVEPEKLDGAYSKFFGKYNVNAFNVTFSGTLGQNQPISATVTNPESLPLTVDEFLNEEMDIEIHDLSENINKPYSPTQLNGSRFMITNASKTRAIFNFLGQVVRKVVGDTAEDSVTYNGRKLEQFFKNKYFNPDYGVDDEINKRIGGLGKNTDGTFRFLGKCISMNKDGVWVSNFPEKTDIHKYKGDYPDDTQLTEAIINAINDTHFDNPVVILVTGHPKDRASYQIQESGLPAEYRSDQWFYAPNSELDNYDNYNIIAWQGIPGTGDIFRLINMGSKGSDATGDFWTQGGRKYPLGEAIARLLSNFYLVQVGEFTDAILVSENIVYHNPFNTTFTINIPIVDSGTINTTFFTFINYENRTINFYDDSSSVGNGLFGYLRNKINIDYYNELLLLNKNNIPGNEHSDVEVVNTNNVITLEYNFGRTIKTNKVVAKFKNPKDYISSVDIVDENGSNRDSNGNPYSIAEVYIKNPNVATSSTGKTYREVQGIYPIYNLGTADPYNRGVFLKNVNGSGTIDGNAFFVLGAQDGKKLRASFSMGVQEGKLNIPLLDMNTGGRNFIGRWTHKGDKHAPDLRSDFLFHDTYQITKCTQAYATNHQNNRR